MSIYVLSVAALRPIISVRSMGLVRRAYHGLGWVGLLLALLHGAGAVAQTGVEHLYDELGRLKAVVTSTGERAEYDYDKAGNLTAIRRVASGALSISEFTPNIGRAGTSVTISGAGFSATPANNTVRFNGTAATVLSASAKRLQVAAPAAGTSGPIAVTVGAATATSSDNFTYTTAGAFGPPTITAFAPDNGLAGTQVIITGTNFDPRATRAEFTGNSPAEIVSLTATQIVAKVPPGAGSGPLTALTPRGIAVSASDFIITPTGYAFADIVARQRASVDSAPVTLDINAISKHGMTLFNGVQGQFLSVQISALTTNPVNVNIGFKIFDPRNVQIASGTVAATVMTVHLPRLPKTGSYSIIFSPGVATARLTFAIVRDAILAVDGPSLPVATATAGQTQRVVFNANAGDRISFGTGSTTTSPAGGTVALSLYKPDGAVFRSCGVFSARGDKCSYSVMDPLPVTGTYGIVASPQGAYTVSFPLTLSRDVPVGTLTVGGALTFSTTRIGQNGQMSFTGTAGQQLSLGISGSSFPSSSGKIFVYQPDGTQLTSGSLAPGVLALSALPVAGTYTIHVIPTAAETGSVTVGLKAADSTSITLDGPPVTRSVTAGQNGRYTVVANAGVRMSIGVSGISSTPSGASVSVSIYNPSGTLFHSCGLFSAAGDKCSYSPMPPLTQSGPHIIAVDPSLPYAETFTVTASTDIQGTLTPGGTAVTFTTTRVGQNGAYRFSAAAGQSLTLLLSGSTLPNYANVHVFRSNGTQLTATTTLTPSLALPNLAADTYTVFVVPRLADTGSVTLRLQ